MKRLSVAVLAPFRSNTWASGPRARNPLETSQDEKKPQLMNIKGTVKADSDKITFVADADGNLGYSQS